MGVHSRLRSHGCKRSFDLTITREPVYEQYTSEAVTRGNKSMEGKAKTQENELRIHVARSRHIIQVELSRVEYGSAHYGISTGTLARMPERNRGFAGRGWA